MGPADTARRRRTAEDSTCLEGGNIHNHESTGLDTNGAGVLVGTRRCVWCGRRQEKPYGSGGRRPWKTVRS